MKTALYYIAGTLITLVVFFSFVELTTRTVSFARGDGFTIALHELDADDDAITDIYQFHPFTGFVFRPGLTLNGGHPRQKGRVSVQVNKQGFLSRTERFEFEKQPGEIRIAMIGASTTAGLNLAYAENWPGRLGAMIGEARPGSAVTVINAGIPGFDTAQSIANLALRVMPFSPDIVLIYHAYNDLKVIRPDRELLPDYTHVHYRPYGLHERQPWYLQVLNNSMAFVRAQNTFRKLKQLQAAADTKAGGNRLDEVPDEAARFFEDNIRTLVGTARAGGAHVVLSSFATLHDVDAVLAGTPQDPGSFTAFELGEMTKYAPGLTERGVLRGIQRYNEVLERIARDEQTGWVDNARLVAHSEENFLDRVHFSATGAERMAENFLPTVLRLLPAAQ